MLLVAAILSVACFCISDGSSVLNKSMDLHNELLSNYAKYIRPCIGCAGPLVINMTFYLTSLNELDEIQGEMNTVGFIKIVWMEERMTWNPMNYAGITSIMFTPDKVWVPPITVGNPSLKIGDLNAHSSLVLVRILYNGMAIWSLGDVFRTTCFYDIYKYPFDKQTCHISFLPWAYTNYEILLNTPEKEIFKPFYQENGEWTLLSTATEAYTANSMSVAAFYLTFERKPTFLVVNVILPIIFLGLLNCMVYVIPIESGERVSYAITVLLSFAVFMTLVNDNIPKTSSPMSLLCYYLVIIFSGSVLIMISTVFNLNLFYRDSATPISTVYRRIIWLSNPCLRRRLNVWKIASRGIKNKVQVIGKPDGNDFHSGENKNNNEDDKDETTENSELTWRIVALAVDKLSFILFNVFFIAVSCGLLIAVMK